METAITKYDTSNVNVGEVERVASILAGGALTAYGLSRRSFPGILLTLCGGSLMVRGVTGHCYCYQALGIDTAGLATDGTKHMPYSIRVEESITVNRAPEDLYPMWRNARNLSRFMGELGSIQEIGDDRWHWLVEGPNGRTFEWQARIVDEIENEHIGWQTMENAEVDHAGSVHFHPAPGGRGTEVKVVLRYEPPAGNMGVVIAKLFGKNPATQVEQCLHRFKQFAETGELATADPMVRG